MTGVVQIRVIRGSTLCELCVGARNAVPLRTAPGGGGCLKEKACQFCRFANCAVGLPGGLFVCDRSHQSYTTTRPGDCCGHFALGKSVPAAGAHDDIRLIPLTQGKFAIVDAADYEWLSQWKWYAHKGHTTYYAVHHPSATTKLILMHRLILGVPDHLLVDHINRNGLNNTRKNIRPCTHAQNIRNQGPTRNSSSKYKGVSWNKADKKFLAAISCERKTYYLGSFKDEIEAAKAYYKKAKQLFEEFAYLNFPEENK